jgi:hypothetical protein
MFARLAICIILTAVSVLPAVSQTLTSSNIRIDWKVDNRFRFFGDPQLFRDHEVAWQQHLLRARGQSKSEEDYRRIVMTTSVLGTEHVFNDRYIPFTRILRTRYDARGWAARAMDATCWSRDERRHSACGSIENYLNPQTHTINARIVPQTEIPLFKELNCEWRIEGASPEVAPCDEPVALEIPYPSGASVSVNIEGDQPVSTQVKVRDILIAGLGDSFASGEGNPDSPVEFTNQGRTRNKYPRRAIADARGDARWLDELCHRSLYGHQLRAALQVAIENPRSAVTFLGYACSGAAIEEGLLGPQAYVAYRAQTAGRGEPDVKPVWGGRRDSQLYWLLSELCRQTPERREGAWACPEEDYRRNVDLLLLSIGGNDIGFRNLVSWVVLRDGATSRVANFMGTALSADGFAERMREILPGAYARLARALETAIPLRNADIRFDPSRIVITAYPDILVDESGSICRAGSGDEPDDIYPANQSLDVFASWLRVDTSRVVAAHAQLAALHKRIGDLAGDHGWTFAGEVYEAAAFRGRGFCAQNRERRDEPTEVLIMPCWGKADRPTATCELNLSGKDRSWRPYDPATQNFPYALRQRWVRTFNDAYLTVNERVKDRDGRILDDASQRVFSETTGAMHPNAEGHAAMADAILLKLRPIVETILQQ